MWERFNSKLIKRMRIEIKRWRNLKKNTISDLKIQLEDILQLTQEKLKIPCVEKMIKEKIKDKRRKNALRKISAGNKKN